MKVKTFDMDDRLETDRVLIDELHVMGSIHYAARVVGQIRGALESKKNSFLLIITTQSDEPPAGVFRAELQYARGVRAGRIGESRMLPLLYEFPEAMQTDRSKPWADPTYWTDGDAEPRSVASPRHNDRRLSGCEGEGRGRGTALGFPASEHRNWPCAPIR